MRHALAVLLLFTLPGACTFAHKEDNPLLPQPGNGVHAQLTFSLADEYLVGAGRRVRVSKHFQEERSECHENSCNGSTWCGQMTDEPALDLTAACDEGACEAKIVTPARDDSFYPDPYVTVKGLREGKALLRVHATAKLQPANAWDDAIELDFVRATGIYVEHDASSDAAATYGMLPNATFTWCPRLMRDEKILDEVETEYGVELRGAAIGLVGDFAYGCQKFQTLTTGVSDITIRAGGASRTVTARVIDPHDAVSAEFHLARRVDDIWRDVADDVLEPEVTTALRFAKADDPSVRGAWVLSTADGTRALGAAGSARVDDRAVASISNGSADIPFLSVIPCRNMMRDAAQVTCTPGVTTLHFDVGNVATSIPIEVSPSD
jgi:hypothetical protein